MKPKSFLSHLRASSLGLAAASLLIPLLAQPANAATVTWSGATNGTWDTTTANWSGSTFTAGNDVLFTGSPAPTTNIVTQAAALSIASITLDNTWTGLVTLSQANTVSGATTISSGTLALTNSAGLGASAVTINSGGTLAINPGTASSTVSNSISGSGLITAQDPAAASGNTLTLSGIYSGFTGTLNILAGASNNGKVNFSNATQANVMSSGTVQIRSGATLYFNNALNYGFKTQLYGTGNAENLGALRVDGATLSGGVTLFANSNIGTNVGTGTISGAIGESGGSFGFTKVGAATLVLSGPNTYSGTTTISAGTLQIGSGGTSGSLGTAAVTNNATLQLNRTDAFTISNNIANTTAGAGFLNLPATCTGTATLSGVSSFGNSIQILSGAGGLVITGTVTADGGSTSNNGYFNQGGSNTVSIQSGGSFNILGTTNATKPNCGPGQNAAGTSVISIDGGGFTVGGNVGFWLGNNVNTATGVLTVNSGTASINAGSATLQNVQNFIAMGRDGANGIINLNGGVLATGRQFVRDGSGGGTAGSGAATINFNGGTLKALADQTSGNGWFETATTGNFQVVTTTVKAGGANINTNNFTTNINTVLAHDSGLGGTADGGLTKSGSGTLNLGAANTYTGATNVTSGTLGLTGVGAINSSSGITINGSGAKFLQTSSVASTPAITLTQGTLDGTGAVGAVTVGAGTGGIVANGNGSVTTALTLGSLTFSGAGTASLRLAGGAISSSPALAVTGALTLSGGAGSVTVNLTPTAALISGSTYQLISYGGSFTGNASTDFTLAPGVLSGRQSGVFASTQATNGAITLAVAGDNPVWSGAVSSILVQSSTNSALTTGNLALKTQHTATDFWTNDALEFNDTYNVGSGDVAVTQTTVNINGGATNAGGIAANTVTFNNSAVDYSITSSDGTGITAGIVSKNGTGKVTISNTNSYTGATTINAGTLSVSSLANGGSNSGIGASTSGAGNLILNGGTLQYTGAAVSTNRLFSLQSSSTIDASGSGAVNFTNTGSMGFNAGTAAKTLTLTGTNTGANTLAAVIGDNTGATSLVKSGSGSWALTGVNSYTGDTTISAGTLSIGGAGQLGSGSYAGNITNNGVLSYDSSASQTFSGSISGIGSLKKTTGGNTLTLTGSSSYSGGTTISAGTLSVGNNNALGSGTVTISGGALSNTTDVTLSNSFTIGNGASFTTGGGAMVVNGNITGSPTGSWTLTPTNKITLGGSNSLTMSVNFGGMTINAGAGGVDITGTTVINGASGNTFSGYFNEAGTTGVTIQSGGSLTFNGTPNGSKPDSIIGNNAAGTSTLTLNGGSLNVGTETGFGLGNNITTAIGVLTISSGTATISRGSTTATDNRSYITLGRDTGTGTINLNGGVLATDRNFIRDGNGAADTTGAANFVFGGGTLKALADQTDWLNSTAKNTNQLALSSVTTTAASTIDSNGHNVAINSSISGVGGFNVVDSVGTGSVTLGGASNYTGATNINSGKLVVSGSLTATSAVSVASGATLQSTGLINTAAAISLAGTLSGSGTVGAVTVNAGGTLSASTANLTTGALTLSSSGTFALSLNTALGTTSKVTASSITLDSGNTAVLTITDTGIDTALAIGTKFAFLDYSGSAPVGRFSYQGNVLNDGAQITLGSNTYTISYFDTDNGSSAVTLTTAAVPEPSTWAMLVGGLGMLLRFQKSRRGAKLRA